MSHIVALLNLRRLATVLLVALVSAGPIACAIGEPSARKDCHKGPDMLECL